MTVQIILEAFIRLNAFIFSLWVLKGILNHYNASRGKVIKKPMMTTTETVAYINGMLILLITILYFKD